MLPQPAQIVLAQPRARRLPWPFDTHRCEGRRRMTDYKESRLRTDAFMSVLLPDGLKQPAQDSRSGELVNSRQDQFAHVLPGQDVAGAGSS